MVNGTSLANTISPEIIELLATVKGEDNTVYVKREDNGSLCDVYVDGKHFGTIGIADKLPSEVVPALRNVLYGWFVTEVPNTSNGKVKS